MSGSILSRHVFQELPSSGTAPVSSSPAPPRAPTPLTATDRGKTLTVRVIGSKTGYTSVAKTSAAKPVIP